MDWVLRNRPEVAVVALGANDGLRGLATDAMETNLVAIVERSRAGGARVLVAGMEVPPNYGAAYARAFRGVFPDVARRTGSPLMPFLLDGVAADPRLNQAGRHPPERRRPPGDRRARLAPPDRAADAMRRPAA